MYGNQSAGGYGDQLGYVDNSAWSMGWHPKIIINKTITNFSALLQLYVWTYVEI